MQRIARFRWPGLIVLLTLSLPGFSQAGQPAGNFIVAGHSGQAPVTQFNGHPYVAVDALAKLMSGSLGYQGNTITLTLPGKESASRSQAAQSRAFSTNFLNASIETTSDIREWRSALQVAVENGYKLADAGVAGYQSQATKSFQLASVAATTDSDHNALGLLRKELGYMQELNDKVAKARNNLSYLGPDALQKDPLDQKIVTCARSLAQMAASGQFNDDGSCR
jgi:hypothetical protein